MSRQAHAPFLIIGAGPTGIGAALRLQELNADYVLLDAESDFGGLASSFTDDQGFTWDLGGHVQFSHYDRFDHYMNFALGEDGWLTHQRESWVWIRNRFIPYPLQNNLHRLDPQERWDTVRGLLEAHHRQAQATCRPQHFGEWMQQTFGPGIVDVFMRPYNFKVWAYPAEEMDFGWIGERVAVPPLDRVLKGICLGQDDVSWGPNAVFRFPKHGGTGAVWRALGATLPPERVALRCRVDRIDPATRTAFTHDGRTWRYQHLISTVPLNHLARLTGLVPADQADRLRFSSTHIVGVGVDGQPPDHLRTKCWMYFPEANSPYYRITVFSNYSPNNVPRPGEQWSLMVEISESPHKPVQADTLIGDTIRAMVEDQLIPDPARIISRTHRRLPQGYPTPFLGRDALVDTMLRTYEHHGIYSRGRFGAWKYEVSNQDHSFAQGYECVNRLTAGGGAESEPTLHTPGVVNARRNP